MGATAEKKHKRSGVRSSGSLRVRQNALFDGLQLLLIVTMSPKLEMGRRHPTGGTPRAFLALEASSRRRKKAGQKSRANNQAEDRWNAPMHQSISAYGGRAETRVFVSWFATAFLRVRYLADCPPTSTRSSSRRDPLPAPRGDFYIGYKGFMKCLCAFCVDSSNGREMWRVRAVSLNSAHASSCCKQVVASACRHNDGWSTDT